VADLELGNVYKVKLVDALNPSQRFVFDATPDLIEAKQIEYRAHTPPHMPVGIHVYAFSSSRTYSISAIKLISRTQEEASVNLAKINLIRSWAMPSFGQGTRENTALEFDSSIQEIEKRRVYGNESVRKTFGSPPPILLLSAYSDGNVKQRNISRIPVVMTQYSLPYPSDCDYIPTLDGTPFPIIMTVDMTFIESQAPNTVATKFDLHKYKQGILTGF
jgi:hypothetical protein